MPGKHAATAARATTPPVVHGCLKHAVGPAAVGFDAPVTFALNDLRGAAATARVARPRLCRSAQASGGTHGRRVAARTRASRGASATRFGAPTPAAPAAVRRVAAQIATVAVDVEPFASRVIKLAALAMVVGRVLLGAGAPLLRVRTQEALVIRMRARVVNNGTTSSVHFARGGVVGTKSRRRSHRNKHREDEKLHRTVDRGDRGDRKALRQSDECERSPLARRSALAAACYDMLHEAIGRKRGVRTRVLLAMRVRGCQKLPSRRSTLARLDSRLDSLYLSGTW